MNIFLRNAIQNRTNEKLFSIIALQKRQMRLTVTISNIIESTESYPALIYKCSVLYLW